MNFETEKENMHWWIWRRKSEEGNANPLMKERKDDRLKALRWIDGTVKV